MIKPIESEETFSISPAQFSAIVNQSPVGMYAVDSELRLQRINPKALPIFSTAENPVGRELRELLYILWPRDAADEMLERFQHTLTTGEPFFSRKSSEVRDGRSAREYYDWELHRIPLPQGCYEVVCYIIDVSAFVLAQKALRDGEQQLRATFNQAAVGMVIADLHGRFEQVNQKFSSIVGYTQTELYDRTFESLIHPEDLLQTQTAFKQLLSGQAAEHAMEKRYFRKDGSVVWGLTTISLLKDTAGWPQQFMGVIEEITARKQAQESVRQSEKELHVLADAIPQLAWIARADGHIFWYNRRWYDYTGTTLEQMEGWGWRSVHHPTTLPHVIERWQSSIQNGTPFQMDFPLRGADGVFRWFLTRVNPVRDSEGRITRWFGTNTDVDQVKRAEEALREETRILELLNKTGTAIAAKLDLQLLVQTVTDAATQLSGAQFGAFFYNAVDQQGESLVLYSLSGAPREAFEKLGLPRRTPIFAETFQNEAVVRSADITLDPRYGKMAPHHGIPQGHLPVRSYLAVPVISRSGEPIGGLLFGHAESNIFSERSERLIVGIAAQAATAIDNARLYEAAQKQIAERVQAEQKLRDSETRLRLSIEATALGTWEYNLVTGTTVLDHRCRELFDFPAEATIDYAAFLAAVHPEDRARITQALQGLIPPKGDGYAIEFRTGGSTGCPERWIRGTGKAFLGEKSDVVRLIGTVLDITDVVKARETMGERRLELEQLVTERTASLREAITQMEEFSYTVSHDLRSPLRAIQGYAEIVLEDYKDRLDAPGRNYLERISRACARMDRLTQDVLTYSKIGRAVVRMEPVSLDKLVAETIHQYIHAPDLQSGVVVEGPLPSVMGYEPSLVQAVSNLLANAVKFVPQGELPRVRVWADRRDDQVRLWVEDHGIGVPPEYQERIWGMFERLNPHHHYDGTGIGLAIVRKTIEQMGGRVGLESDGKTGSRFWIQLPAAPF